MTAPDCPGCLAAIRVARRHRISQCALCGVDYVADEHKTLPVPQRTASVTKRLDPQPERNRREVPKEWSVEIDMPLLARFLPAIEGHAASTEPTVRSGSARNGRSDSVDNHAREHALAVEIHKRVDGLRATEAGRMHCAVLRFAFLDRGVERGAKYAERTKREARAEEVGMAFATPAIRQKWREDPSRILKGGAPGRLGRRLLDEATRAYENGK